MSRLSVASTGYEIVFAGELNSVTGEIHHRDRVGTRAWAFWHEVAEASAQRVAVEVARPDHVEARRLQGLRDQARVIGRGRERRLGHRRRRRRRARSAFPAAAARQRNSGFPKVRTEKISRHSEKNEKALVTCMASLLAYGSPELLRILDARSPE